MGRTHTGYMRANQSVLEEEDEDAAAQEDDDLEAGHASRSALFQDASSKTKLHGKRRVAWGTGEEASEMNTLRPNIRQADPKQDEVSSDDEPPQDLMIEAAATTTRKPASPPPAPKGKERETRRRPLYSTSRKQAGPILPTTNGAPVSIPPRPSELEEEDSHDPPPLQEQPATHMRGLDAHERALWNWVNVYNLDAFLQEAYLYYEGKGIYSIALSRGLNLLSVILLEIMICVFGC